MPSEGLLEDMNELQIILVVTITETNQIIYTTAAVITEILGYKMNSVMEKEIEGQYQGSTKRS